MTPSKEQIQAKATEYASDGIRIDIRGNLRSGFIDGAEWMEQQLEPMITEYGMNEIKLKERISELEPKWIDVEKQLPEITDQQYLVCMKNKNKENGIWLIDMATWNGPEEGWSHFNSWEKVIGWMPLPEPPKDK